MDRLLRGVTVGLGRLLSAVRGRASAPAILGSRPVLAIAFPTFGLPVLLSVIPSVFLATPLVLALLPLSSTLLLTLSPVLSRSVLLGVLLLLLILAHRNGGSRLVCCSANAQRANVL